MSTTTPPKNDQVEISDENLTQISEDDLVPEYIKCVNRAPILFESDALWEKMEENRRIHDIAETIVLCGSSLTLGIGIGLLCKNSVNEDDYVFTKRTAKICIKGICAGLSLTYGYLRYKLHTI